MGTARSHRPWAGWTSLIAPLAITSGALAQWLIAPRPAALVAVAALTGLGLTAVGLARPRRLGNRLGGFGFAATVLLSLAGAAAIGTIVLQQKPEETYRAAYGRLAGAIIGLGLPYVAHTFWFAALVGLLFAGLAISMVQRWPPRRKNLGFFFAHLGLFSMVAGGGLSAMYAIKGRVDLHVGGPAATTAVLDRSGMPAGTVDLGFSVKLDQFDVDRYEDRYRLAVYRPKGHGWSLAASFPIDRGVWHRLPGGGRFTVQGYYPDLVVNDELEETAGGEPALRVSIDGQDELLASGRDRADSLDGTVAVRLGARSAGPPARGEHLLTLDGVTQPVRPGGEVRFPGGVSIKALRFFRRFGYDIGTRSAYDRPSGPENPTLEVQITTGGQLVHRWLYANFAGHGEKDDGVPDVGYRFVPATPVERAVTVDASRREVTVVDHGGRSVQPYADGLTLLDGRVRLSRLLASARVVHRPSSASAQEKNPAVEVDVRGVPGPDGRTLLSARDGDAVKLAGAAVLTFERRPAEVRAYRSRITAVRDGRTETAVVAVNRPMTLGPWKLYQVNFDEHDPTYSGLEVVRDPGAPWVFLGFLLTGLGVLDALTPKWRRRHPEEA